MEPHDRGDTDPDGVLRHAEELRRWARLVRDAADGLAAVVAALPGTWADPVGREWTERLRLVGTELARQAEQAQHLARRTEHPVAGPDGATPLGVRLGGQSGSRVTDRRGVVVPTLPPPWTHQAGTGVTGG